MLLRVVSRSVRVFVGVLALIAFGYSGVLRAQTSLIAPVYIGAGATAGLNLHQMDIPVFDCSPFFGVFTSALGVRPNFFIALELPLQSASVLNPDWNGLWIFPKLHVNFLGASTATPAVDNGNARSPFDSTLVPTYRENRLSSSITELGADLFISYQFSSMFKIFAGPSVGTFLGANWTTEQVITTPANAIFPSTHNNTLPLQSGNIPSISGVFASVSLGAGMNVPLGHTSRLTPEISFTYPLTSIRTDMSWRVMSLRLGTGIEFNVASTPKKPEPVILPPIVHSLNATVKIVGVLENANGDETTAEVPVPSIRIEEFVRREAYPMLNYVFFAEGSADIPSRYYLFGEKAGTESFDLNSLAGQKTLSVYYHVLNIIGKRMITNPAATLRLIGSNDNVGAELNATHLSAARADAVKKYFVDVWKIDPNRISTEATNLPHNPSPSETSEGQEENRRVEMIASDPTILDPVSTEQIDRTMNPPILRVRTSIASSSSTTSSLDLEQNGKIVQDFGEAKPAQEWKPSQKEVPSAEQPLVAALHVRNEQGDSTTVYDSAIVHQITIQKKRQEKVNDKIIERYSLITFDFDKSDLDTRSKRTIANLAQNVTPTDTIHVTGYTDMTGEANHNKTLSGDRATKVMAALKSETAAKAPHAAIVATGEGEKDLVDNKLPEGRFLSRTVNIRIERPISAE